MDAWRAIAHLPRCAKFGTKPKRTQIRLKVAYLDGHILGGCTYQGSFCESDCWLPSLGRHSRMTASQALQEITTFGGSGISVEIEIWRRKRLDLCHGKFAPVLALPCWHPGGRRPFTGGLQGITTEEAQMAALQMLAGSHVASLGVESINLMFRGIRCRVLVLGPLLAASPASVGGCSPLPDLELEPPVFRSLSTTMLFSSLHAAPARHRTGFLLGVSAK